VGEVRLALLGSDLEPRFMESEGRDRTQGTTMGEEKKDEGGRRGLTRV